MWKVIRIDQYLLLHKTSKKFLERKCFLKVEGYQYKELYYAYIIYNDEKKKSFAISECNDEWYVVKATTQINIILYKCDQLDSVIKLIKSYE